MMTPFDWQEGMTHRASFVEARLQGGTPVVAASCAEGILMLTARRQAAKIYEVYDRLMVGLIGEYSARTSRMKARPRESIAVGLEPRDSRSC